MFDILKKDNCQLNCKCELCRELSSPGSSPRSDYCSSPTAEISKVFRPMDSTNFILRRAMPFVSRAPSKEWQEATMVDDYGTMSTLEDTTKLLDLGLTSTNSSPSLVGGRIMDGDYGKFTPSRPAPPKPDQDPNKIVIHCGENSQEEIVVHVSPSREDVLKIEEDETRIEDYWSLPGDTTGFKADWSFVQQWRLRGPSGAKDVYCPPYGKDSPESARLESDHPHHHHSLHLRRPECTENSSSDENRSSGHASMSDTGGHSSSSPYRAREQLNSVPEDDRFSASVTQRRNRGPSRNRHRATPAKLQVPWNGSGLEDIKLAIQQLTMRSHTSTSTYSSLSGSESSEPAVRRLMRHSSLETINTNVTSADEFVWVDSHNRLVELQSLPWSHHDVLRVLQTGRAREHMDLVSMDTIPRLSYLLQRALVRVAREIQRLARPLGLCSKHEVASALKIVLCPALADSCIKACFRAAAMFAVSGDQLRQSKSSRSGLTLPVGRFLRWMSDVRLGKMVHEYAAIYLAAGMENLLEEILLQCLPPDAVTLTATMLEHAIANNGDLWGLLQPYAHLNAGRTASGALAMPRWASVSSLNSSTSKGSRDLGNIEPSLLTTCVGSLSELLELISKLTHAGKCPTPLTSRALNALFYYMRCSQLEHGDKSAGIQELAYERAYVVLPPLVEWLRVSAAHSEYRHGGVVDHDDVNQAARLLLPGVDCPVRPLCFEEVSCRRADDEFVKRLTLDMAFKMLTSGRRDLVSQALPLLPPTKINTVNDSGLTALMLACIANNEAAVTTLLDAGADPNIESPTPGATPLKSTPKSQSNAETQHWTALTFVSLLGHCQIARILLERGAKVEGGARVGEDKCTVTPLQAATATGCHEMVALLLAHGAQPFLSTIVKDGFSYSGAAQRGCYSAICVATAHGQRACLHQLLSHPLNFSRKDKEVLSLEEILAEGSTEPLTKTKDPVFNKVQSKALQEAMYHSAESNHLEITMELRGLGVTWTLHCWMASLATAHEMRIDTVIDQLLQDFLQVCPDDYSSQFVQECLPLLFNIFRYNKEGTTLLLADIFCNCYGWEPIKKIRDTTVPTGSRIDPKFVNNPELSDVQFRVEGRVFYGHKIVLITSSPRFRNMLSSKLCEGNPPIVQINDIRYHIFQMVMEFLYHGGCASLQVNQSDVLELMAAANFFQLDGLLRYCEAQCSSIVDLDNVVSMYIHAKVYNANQLLEYCQGFLLQNMVALMTYDDSVKRLLFAKKLPNHDVLAGLLATLQSRIKSRKQYKN
ncbi:ankyrin repeat and BTB/POZ domain-containing protein 2 isoform X2 [Cotesia glomerata]|uniref:ankyrin repeat and BTB/POZ domain-containing protein 2 isoform X2 n=1 Tax=Cotesia glomerata TaxID=32391 RepID=UPI001D0194D1|nr:ankyrin repeat and BTB/POZ domain-containing protein 2 isoform X2 [Cotesia glomerata]